MAPEVRVNAVGCKQRPVIALLDETTPIHHEDAVDVANGRQSMRNDQHGAILANRPHALLNGAFGFKFSVPAGFTIVTNALVPLNRGGLRANITYTTGLEFAF